MVGGTGSRGVVTSASYEARRLRRPLAPCRRSARAGSARTAIFLPPDFEAYRAHSNRFREILLAHTPLVEPISLDEAFLDVGGATLLFGSPERSRRRSGDDVAREVGVTCSVGIAPTKFVAKLASDGCKPDGLLHVPVEEVASFLEPAARRAALGGGGEDRRSCWGAWRSARSATWAGPRRRSSSVSSARRPRATSRRWRAGIDDRPVVPYEQPKSIGHEETFDRDLDDEDEILRELLALSGRVAARLREDGYRSRTVTLKVRLANFTTLTRSRTQTDPTDLGADLHRIASELYRAPPGIEAPGPAAGRPGGRAGLRGRPAAGASCARNAGTTWSAPSIASSAVSARARRAPRASSTEPVAASSTLWEALSIIVGDGSFPTAGGPDAPQRSRAEDPRRDRAAAL